MNGKVTEPHQIPQGYQMQYINFFYQAQYNNKTI